MVGWEESDEVLTKVTSSDQADSAALPHIMSRPYQAVPEVPHKPEQPRKKKRRKASPDAWQQNRRKHQREKESRTLGNRTSKTLLRQVE